MKTLSGIILLVGILTLVVAPATCSSGLLAHCCTPGDEDHEDDHHEHACPTDPCNRDTVTGPAKVKDGDAPAGAASPAVLPPAVALATPTGASLPGSAAPPPVRTARPERTLPLLC